jgi:catechol 2,3-dioxygenase-like lactoylglutathione lyase family enzyme
MDMKVEVVVVPVSDVDRAKDFYERLGFRADIDFVGGDGYRVVQLTPPGSACSIIFGKGITSARPGSIDRLVLAVHDVGAARDELRSHGVEVSVFHDAGGGLGGGFFLRLDGIPPTLLDGFPAVTAWKKNVAAVREARLAQKENRRARASTNL